MPTNFADDLIRLPTIVDDDTLHFLLVFSVAESQTEGRNQSGFILDGRLDVALGEALLQMRETEESVVEVERGDLIGHSGVVRGCGVAVAEDNVVEPLGNDAVGVHQVSNGFQNGFEVVFLGLAAHEDVE